MSDKPGPVPPELTAAVDMPAAPLEPASAEIVAGQIRAELGRARMSQSVLAERLGVSHSWVYRRLIGEAPLTVADVQAIANALGVAVEVLSAPLAGQAEHRKAAQDLTNNLRKVL